MRAILITCGIILLAVVTWIVLSLRAPNHYGAEFTGAPKAEVADLLDRPADFLGKRMTLQGKVQDQCPTTGCFFYFSAGNRKLKIELGDLAQRIPKRPGAPVTVEGQLVPYGDTYQFLGTAAEFN
jgi:hypothetical protein